MLGSEAAEENSSGLLSKDFVLSVWEERKVRLYSENCNVHQSRSQNASVQIENSLGGIIYMTVPNVPWCSVLTNYYS